MEHDPLEIWSTQLGVLVEAAGGIGVDLSDVALLVLPTSVRQLLSGIRNGAAYLQCDRVAVP